MVHELEERKTVVYEVLTQEGKAVEVPRDVYVQWPIEYRREYSMACQCSRGESGGRSLDEGGSLNGLAEPAAIPCESSETRR